MPTLPKGPDQPYLPTTVGWGYADRPNIMASLVGQGPRDPIPLRAYRGRMGRLLAEGKDVARHRWLAPIPPPPVCATLADLARAHYQGRLAASGKDGLAAIHVVEELGRLMNQLIEQLEESGWALSPAEAAQAATLKEFPGAKSD